MEQKIITAGHVSTLNREMEELIKEGWIPVGSHQVVTKIEQLQYSGMQHKRTLHEVEYSQTMRKEG